MNRTRIAAVGTAVLLCGILGSAQQAVTSDAVLVRNDNNQLFVSSVVAKPGDTVGISAGQVVVNGRATAIRVRVATDWAPREVAAGTYFVAGDPAGLGTADRAWGLIPENRVVGTVQLGVLPRK